MDDGLIDGMKDEDLEPMNPPQSPGRTKRGRKPKEIKVKKVKEVKEKLEKPKRGRIPKKKKLEEAEAEGEATAVYEKKEVLGVSSLIETGSPQLVPKIDSGHEHDLVVSSL